MMEQMDGNQKTGKIVTLIHPYFSLLPSLPRACSMFFYSFFSNCKHLFSDLFYTDKGFKQTLTFHLTLFFEICCVRRISVIFFKISWDSSKSQLSEIINVIKLFSIWAAFHRQITCSPAVF